MTHKRILISGLDLYNRGFDGMDDEVLESINRAGLYEVYWPQHVTIARYNGDCDFSEVNPNDYRHSADIANYDVYADSDTWNMLPWFSAETLEQRMNL